MTYNIRYNHFNKYNEISKYPLYRNIVLLYYKNKIKSLLITIKKISIDFLDLVLLMPKVYTKL